MNLNKVLSQGTDKEYEDLAVEIAIVRHRKAFFKKGLPRGTDKEYADIAVEIAIVLHRKASFKKGLPRGTDTEYEDLTTEIRSNPNFSTLSYTLLSSAYRASHTQSDR